MAAALQEAYGRLEEKVAERTRKLALANQKLDEASRHKSAFLAGMSHELRTPLNAIIGFSEVLLDTELPVTEAEKKQFLTDIFNGGRRLLMLINDVLDLSKIEAGRMELQIEPVSMSEIIERTHNIIRPLANKKRIDCRVYTNGTDLVSADAARIEQVMLNLLGNAVKFTPAGGNVWVRSGRTGGVAQIEVGDSGPGISNTDRERIFLEFQRATMKTDGAKPEGTGLGLALARMFVELHGGTLWVESEIGRGSRFYFTLPLASDPVKTLTVSPE
jgi:signal transduction histidine kinase